MGVNLRGVSFRSGWVGAVVLVAALLSGCASSPAPLPSPATSASHEAGAERPSAVGESPHYLHEATPGAAVTVVEFVDFQCPPCGRLAPTMSVLAEEYSGTVNFVVRHLPLSMHANAVPAAVAVEAAAAQDAFAAMYTAVFATQEQWSSLPAADATAFFRVVAGSLGLDVTLWDAAILSPEVGVVVQADLDAATALGAQSTPTVFVNDHAVRFDTVDALRAMIDAAIATAAG